MERAIVEIPNSAEICVEILLHPANRAMMSTPTVRCRWEDETAKEMTGHPPSKKMKSLTLHTHGCIRTSQGAALLILE